MSGLACTLPWPCRCLHSHPLPWLLIRLDISSNAIERVVYPLIAGLGIGMTFHSPYQILANAVEPERLASATGAFFLVRFIATTVGVVSAQTPSLTGLFSPVWNVEIERLADHLNFQSTAGVIFTSQLASRLPEGFKVDRVLIDLGDLTSIPDPVLRRQVLHATSKALSVRHPSSPHLPNTPRLMFNVSAQMIWTVCCPMVAVACLVRHAAPLLRSPLELRMLSPAHQTKSAD